MIGLVAGRVSYVPAASSTLLSTCGLLNAGRYFDTSSSRPSFPSSTSIITPTEVTALVIDAMLKIVSFFISRALAVLILPNAS